MLELREKLSAARERARRLDKCETLLAAAKAAAAEQRTRLALLESRLAREERDVRRFESMSLVALLHYFLGDAEQRARRERHEAAAAALKCSECRAAVARIEEEIAELERRIGELGDARGQVRELVEAKERQIRSSGGDSARRLFELGDSIVDLKADIDDLNEAIAAGEKAKARLDAARGHLETARGWGTFDLLGGGLMMTAIKHAKFDEARREAQLAQHALSKFSRELADVKARLDEDGSLELGGLTIFADYFFDGLIADWMAQSRINRSVAAVDDLREKVSVLLQRLERRRDAARRGLDRLRTEKVQVIEMA